ncbi:MAG: hypothetical protein KGL39_46070 [Patescibacteria group bacterium]|nr:hypothetical protein [Patescibacteria group bacterium]
MKPILICLLAASLASCGLIPNKTINTIAKSDADWALKDAQTRQPNSPLIPCYEQIDANATADLASGPAPLGILSTTQQAIDECQNLQAILNKCSAYAQVSPLAYATIVSTLGKGCSLTNFSIATAPAK